MGPNPDAVLSHRFQRHRSSMQQRSNLLGEQLIQRLRVLDANASQQTVDCHLILTDL